MYGMAWPDTRTSVLIFVFVFILVPRYSRILPLTQNTNLNHRYKTLIHTGIIVVMLLAFVSVTKTNEKQKRLFWLLLLFHIHSTVSMCPYSFTCIVFFFVFLREVSLFSPCAFAHITAKTFFFRINTRKIRTMNLVYINYKFHTELWIFF